MKRRKSTVFTSLIVTIAIMMSFGGYLYADETDTTEIPEELEVEEVEEPSEVVDEIIPEDEEDPSEEETEAVEETNLVESEVDNETSDEPDEFISDEYTYVTNVDFDDDYLAEQYIMQQMSMGTSALYSGYDYLSRLTYAERTAYDILYPQLCAIAAGTDDDMSTEFVIPITLTASDLGLNNLNDAEAVKAAINSLVSNMTDSLIMTLLESCPYELYWFDKTSGYAYGKRASWNDVVYLTYYLDFSVANTYQDGSKYKVSSVYGQSASAAAANACQIIYENSGLDDYDKLVAYRDAICNLVDYNYDALKPGVSYGDPWQIVWVFDGDTSTNVVCEGFAKSFQYLCDCSVFQGEVYAISVTGWMTKDPNNLRSGGHMWNVVSIEGNNYLVDITQYDGEWGSFLLGLSSTTYPTYVYAMDDLNILYYTYDEETISFFGDNALTLAPTNYVPSSVATPEFTGHSMQLSGQIGLQFFVELPSDVVGDCYMTFSDEYGHIDSTHPYELIRSNKTTSSTPYYYAQINISSIQMAEQITPVVHCGDRTFTGESYSAQDYINWGLNNLNPTSREYKIICALADYGHYSQPYLSQQNGWNETQYPTMNTYMTASYNYEDVKEATAINEIVRNVDNTVFSSVTFSLRFGDQVTLRLFFAPADSVSIDANAFMVDGVSVPVVRDANGRYVVTISGIPATQLGASHVITYDGTSITVSPYSYVYAMLNTGDDHINGKNLVCALYYLAQICAN